MVKVVDCCLRFLLYAFMLVRGHKSSELQPNQGKYNSLIYYESQDILQNMVCQDISNFLAITKISLQYR